VFASTANAVAGITADGYTLGVLRRTSPVFYADLVLGELCLWPRVLTAAELFRERQRLDSKWGANFAPFERGRLSTLLVTP